MQVVMRLLLNKGDTVLVEEYTYPHIPESLVLPPGFVPIPVKMDAHGIIPSQLRQVLKELQAAGKPLPKLLYTVPTGQNPTGAASFFYIPSIQKVLSYSEAALNIASRV